VKGHRAKIGSDRMSGKREASRCGLRNAMDKRKSSIRIVQMLPAIRAKFCQPTLFDGRRRVPQ
jgi:hypothetical protein